jgi:hypothetical protein
MTADPLRGVGWSPTGTSPTGVIRAFTMMQAGHARTTGGTFLTKTSIHPSDGRMVRLLSGTIEEVFVGSTRIRFPVALRVFSLAWRAIFIDFTTHRLYVSQVSSASIISALKKDGWILIISLCMISNREL